MQLESFLNHAKLLSSFSQHNRTISGYYISEVSLFPAYCWNISLWYVGGKDDNHDIDIIVF